MCPRSISVSAITPENGMCVFEKAIWYIRILSPTATLTHNKRQQIGFRIISFFELNELATTKECRFIYRDDYQTGAFYSNKYV